MNTKTLHISLTELWILMKKFSRGRRKVIIKQMQNNQKTIKSNLVKRTCEIVICSVSENCVKGIHYDLDS